MHTVYIIHILSWGRGTQKIHLNMYSCISDNVVVVVRKYLHGIALNTEHARNRYCIVDIMYVCMYVCIYILMYVVFELIPHAQDGEYVAGVYYEGVLTNAQHCRDGVHCKGLCMYVVYLSNTCIYLRVYISTACM